MITKPPQSEGTQMEERTNKESDTENTYQDLTRQRQQPVEVHGSKRRIEDLTRQRQQLVEVHGSKSKQNPPFYFQETGSRREQRKKYFQNKFKELKTTNANDT